MVAAYARLGQAIVRTGQMCPIENAASRTREQHRQSASCRWQKISRFLDESSANLSGPQGPAANLASRSSQVALLSESSTTRRLRGWSIGEKSLLHLLTRKKAKEKRTLVQSLDNDRYAESSNSSGVHFDFEPSRIGSVSTNLRTFTICRVRSLYFLKCGL
jgi:hypothetical protein